jgi:hypothetical protein
LACESKRRRRKTEEERRKRYRKKHHDSWFTLEGVIFRRSGFENEGVGERARRETLLVPLKNCPTTPLLRTPVDVWTYIINPLKTEQQMGVKFLQKLAAWWLRKTQKEKHKDNNNNNKTKTRRETFSLVWFYLFMDNMVRDFFCLLKGEKREGTKETIGDGEDSDSILFLFPFKWNGKKLFYCQG